MRKKTKFYKSYGMLRAKAYKILHHDVVAIAYYDFDFHVIATDSVFGYSRDCMCFRKDFAKKTAGISQYRQMIYALPINELETLLINLREQYKEFIGKPAKRVYDFSISIKSS